MERDERAEGGCGIRLGVHHPLATVVQALAHADEEGGKHSLLSAEVTVDGWAADAGRSAQVFDRDPVEAALGEEPGRRFEQRAATVGLRAAAQRFRAVGHPASSERHDDCSALGHLFPLDGEQTSQRGTITLSCVGPDVLSLILPL